MITTMICVEWCLTRYPTKIFVTDAIRVRLAPYSIHDYPYLYSRTSVFVFVFEAIRIRIRIRIKIWKQIWFHWYPSVFDPITPLLEKSKPRLGPSSSSESRHPEGKGRSAYMLVKALVSKLARKRIGLNTDGSPLMVKSAPPGPE